MMLWYVSLHCVCQVMWQVYLRTVWQCTERMLHLVMLQLSALLRERMFLDIYCLTLVVF